MAAVDLVVAWVAAEVSAAEAEASEAVEHQENFSPYNESTILYSYKMVLSFSMRTGARFYKGRF